MASVFPNALTERAAAVIETLRTRGLTVATAESCTGGLVMGLLTEIPGSSDVVDRGLVTYSNAAKTSLLGVPAALIAARGAVSAEVAAAMADGLLLMAPVDIAVSVTGIAGPGGGSAEKPVGLVYLAARRRGGARRDRRSLFENSGRDHVRMEAVRVSLDLIGEVIE